MATKGRPTKYLPAYVVLAEYMAKVGAKDDMIAEVFGVDIETFIDWQLKHADFTEALRKGWDWYRTKGRGRDT